MLSGPFAAQALIAAAAALSALVPPASAVTPPAAAPPIPIAAPDQSRAVALSPAGVVLGGEQWEMFHGDRIVRNVTAPTLTPVLPDPARSNGAAVIVAPGGAFMMLAIDNEGFSEARWLADHGVTAFVLKYRTLPSPRPPEGLTQALDAVMAEARGRQVAAAETPAPALADAQAAVKLVRASARTFRIDPARIGLLGFSAGAMTALAAGVADDRAARPDFIASIYGPMGALAVPADAPPAFVAVALDDPLMTKGKSLDLIQSWRSAGRPIEAHLYARGGHGFGMTPHSAATAVWIDQFYAWMKDQGLLRPAPGPPR